MTDHIVIGICATNETDTIHSAITSALNQQGLKRDLKLILSIDNGTDSLYEQISDFRDDPRIIFTQVSLGQAFMNRNHIIETSLIYFPQGCILGRLDADDVLCNNWVLSKIEKEWDAYNPDVLLSGNMQRDESGIMPWINYADARLLDPDYLSSRLEGMAAGDATAELPSCNTFISNLLPIRYPAVQSAEDHWFTVLILSKKEEIKIHIAEQILYCVYSVTGQTTQINRISDSYQESRRNLLNHFIFANHENK